MSDESNQPHDVSHPSPRSHDAKPYTLKPVITPLPSQQVRSDAEQRTVATNEGEFTEKRPAEETPPKKGFAGNTTTRSVREPQFRDITEDDDGYHPYADAPDTRPLFEENPWD